ncbi:unnamed protein product [Cunninghamella blakesleeana]
MNQKIVLFLLSLSITGSFGQGLELPRSSVGYSNINLLALPNGNGTLAANEKRQQYYCPNVDCGSYCCRAGQTCARGGYCCASGYFACSDSIGKCCPRGYSCTPNSDTCSPFGSGGGGIGGGGGGSGGGSTDTDPTTTSSRTTTTSSSTTLSSSTGLSTPPAISTPANNPTGSGPSVSIPPIGGGGAIPSANAPNSDVNAPNNGTSTNVSNSIYATSEKALYLSCLVLLLSIMMYYI